MRSEVIRVYKDYRHENFTERQFAMSKPDQMLTSWVGCENSGVLISEIAERNDFRKTWVSFDRIYQ